MIGDRIQIWDEEEYSYEEAYGYIPFIVSYIHEDKKIHPGMLIVPGGAYRVVSPSEAQLPAMEFYRQGYNVFVLTYTVNLLNCPLKMQPLKDLSRAIRVIRNRCEKFAVDPDRIAVCGFSAGGHLSASLCVHYKDVVDEKDEYQSISNRPDAAVLSYPVISSGVYAHKDSFVALLGEKPEEKELEYMSLEKHVVSDTPPCFLWQTVTDATVPVENSYLFAQACRKAGVPFAHHVFSEGIHGLSVATQEWLNRDFGDYYTLEQIRFLVKAICSGKTEYSPETGEKIAAEFGIDGNREERWLTEEKEEIRSTLPEVEVWPMLAGKWLERQWDCRQILKKNQTED